MRKAVYGDIDHFWFERYIPRRLRDAWVCE